MADRNRKKKTTNDAPRKAPGFAARAGRFLVSSRFLRPAAFVLFVAAVLAVASSFAGGMDYYRISDPDTCVLFSVNNSPNFTVRSAAGHRPPFLPERDFYDILEARKVLADMKMWDDRIFGAIRAALLSNPWVESVPVVARRFPHFVQVTVRIRIPYARVRWSRRDYYVDRYGVLLPLTERTAPSWHLVSVSGISDPPPANPGERWKSAFLADALSLMRFLQSNLRTGDRFVNLLAVVDTIVCEPAHESLGIGKPQLTLLLTGGCRILWDIYFEQEKAYGRPGRAVKLRNLKECLRRIDDLNGVECIDLSFDQPTVTFKEAR